MIQKIKLLSLILLLVLPGCISKFSNKKEAMPEFSAEKYIMNSHPAGDGTLAQQSSSLWNNGPKSLFGDRRARGLGDILTVVIEIDEEAEMQNSVTQNSANSENFNVNALFGFPEWANGVLFGGATVNPAVDLSRTRATSGNGNIKRQEKITLRLAARVVDVLPNGHLVVVGRQQIGVNHESRNLEVAGIIRPEDISRQNTITYDKIAEARVAYGGKGQISNMVKPPKGSRLLQKIIPF